MSDEKPDQTPPLPGPPQPPEEPADLETVERQLEALRDQRARLEEIRDKVALVPPRPHRDLADRVAELEARLDELAPRRQEPPPPQVPPPERPPGTEPP